LGEGMDLDAFKDAMDGIRILSGKLLGFFQ
jgi:hypothetical protein